VLMKGMAKDPKARWTACGDMVAALEKALEPKDAQRAGAAASHTVVMPPPMPAAAAAAPPWPPPIVAPPAPQPAVTGSFAPPPANAPELRYMMGRAGVSRIGSRWTRRVFTALGVIGALLVLGTAGGLVYAALQPSVSVSPATATPGDQVQVTARNVPAGQQGTIEAFGTSQDFTASGGGVSVSLTVPPQTAPGSYSISVCWDGTCHASTTVRISAGVATPSIAPSPSPSPSSQATPLTLTVSPRTGVVPGRTVLTVTATGLAPGGAKIGVAQGTARQFWDALAGANGNLSKKIVLSATQPAWAAGTAFVTVCDVQYRCTAAVDITVA